jgi:hypothetical protein
MSADSRKSTFEEIAEEVEAEALSFDTLLREETRNATTEKI